MPARKDLRERALSALTRGEKTRHQLKALLARHSDGTDVEAVVADLAAAGLQSDLRAAEVHARSALRKGHTAGRVRQSLRDLGVDESIVSRVVGDTFSAVNERDALEREARALLPGNPDVRTRQKVARALLRKGHDPERVRAACGLDADDVEPAPAETD